MSQRFSNLPRLISFTPLYKQVLWGGSRIAQLKHLDNAPERIGESWEISALENHETVVEQPESLRGATLSQLVQHYGPELVGKHIYAAYGDRFPLLIKYIDAKETLSLQVHPDDNMARRHGNPHGKDEAWLVLKSADDSSIFCGLSSDIDRDTFDSHIGARSIMQQVDEHKSCPGQFYYVPAGTLHAIGGGNFLVEVQQACDITYRVYDFDRRDTNGNLRELHTDLAVEAVTTSQQQKICPVNESRDDITHTCRRFAVRHIRLDGTSVTIDCNEDSFSVYMVIDGTLDIDAGDGATVRLQAGRSVLSPATVGRVTVSGKGQLLRIIALAKDWL